MDILVRGLQKSERKVLLDQLLRKEKLDAYPNYEAIAQKMDIDTFVTLISDIPKGTLTRQYPLAVQKKFVKRTVVL